MKLTRIFAPLLIATISGTIVDTSRSETPSAPIVIGAGLLLTGPNATFGAPHKAALELLIEQVNRIGGILNGRKIKLVIEDVGNTPEDAITGIRRLLREKPVAIMGLSLSSQMLALAPIIKAAEIPTLHTAVSPSVAASKVGHRFYFRFTVPASETSARVVGFTTKDLAAKRIALVYDDSEFGKGWADATRPALAAQSAEIVVQERLNIADNDASAQVANVLKANPDAILTQLYPKQLALFTREYHKRGAQIPIVGTAAHVAMQQGVLPWSAGQGIYTVAIVPSVADLSAAQHVKDWVKAVNSKSNTPLTEVTAQAYDSFLVLLAAIEKAGDDPKKIGAAIAQTKNFTEFKTLKTLGGPYTCTAEHDCLNTGAIAKIQGEGLVVVKQYGQD